MINIDSFSKESSLVTEELKNQMRPVLDKLDRNIVLCTIPGEEQQKREELISFLLSITSLSPHLTLEAWDEGESEVSAMRKDLLPVTGIYVGGEFTGISFSGVPAGKEITSFLLSLYNTGGCGQPIEPEWKERVEQLRGERQIDIAVSLSCHYCQEVVTSCQRIASLNNRIKARMIDARLYPEFVERYKIERIPVMIIDNDTIITGAKKFEEIVKILEEH